MGFCNQVCLLTCKNCLIQRRRICVTIFEVLLPVCFSTLVTFIRSKIEPVNVPHVTYYDNKTVDTEPGTFPTEEIIGYVPASKATKDVMDHVLLLMMRDMSLYSNFSVKGFKTEAESINYYQVYSVIMQHIIVFNGVSSTSNHMPRKVSFSIRPHSPGQYWYTDLTYPLFLEGKPRARSTYYSESAVLYLQGVVGEALARYWIAKRGRDPDSIGFEIYTKVFPFPPHYYDKLASVLRPFLSLFIVLSFMLSVVVSTKNLVNEKEKKLKESMKLMGLTSAAYWTSWYLTISVYLVPAMGLYTLMFVLSISSNGPVLSHSSSSLFFVLLLVYAHAIITFCFMISALVQKANTGAVVSGIVFFVFYCPYFYLFENFDKISRRIKLLYGLMFNTAMAMAINVLGAYEGSGEGATWANFNERPQDDFSISMRDCMIMMLISSTIHLLITWYLDNVRPGEFGVPKPYTFCFTKSYWLGGYNNKKGSFRFDLPESKYFEKDPTGRVAGIRICNLRKTFGRRVAVEGTSLNMYEGQITVLLGRNGAGKTTTMAMITGFIPPTSGTAIVNGYDIRTNIDDVRRSMGLCPQHDVLFDKMTVSEHFRFFAKMKGYSSPKFKEEILEMAMKVGLRDKLNTYSKKLSGGQRRKLSIGIALIGGPQVVILDEPSSGMDPSARRHIWSVLQEARKGRTIMLTTHYMDEADLLGDRIAIMAGGVVKCCGTPLYLKKLYGTGYHLIVEVKPECDVPSLTKIIQAIIAKAALETVINREVTYLLPDREISKFATLFDLLDSEKVQLHISSFGTSATTMEEVFLKVGEPTEDNVLLSKPTSRTSSRNTNGSGSPGDGLYLTVTKKREGNLDKITGIVKLFFPKAKPTKVSNIAVTYLLPENDSEKLAALSNKLEKTKEALQIITFTTSSQRTSGDDQSSMVDYAVNYSSNQTTDYDISFGFKTGFSKKTGMSLELSRMTGVFVKKALLTWRNRIITLAQIMIPAIFAFLATLSHSSSERPKEPPLTLNIIPFGKTRIPYTDGQVQSSYSSELANLYAKQFCTCHNTEYVKLKPGETFDMNIGEKAKHMSTSEYTRKMIIGMEVIQSSSPNKVAAIAYYNIQPIHSEAISVNYVVNTLLQYALNSTFALKSKLSPLPWAWEGSKFAASENDKIGFEVAVCIIFAMSFVTALFIASLIKERQTGAKHMQIMTGISPVTYWVPTFLWDFVNFIVPSLAIPIIFKLYALKPYTEDWRWVLVILVLVMYSWAVLPLMYLLQFLFKSPPSGIVMVIMLNFLTGVPTLVAVTILKSPQLKTAELGKTLDKIFSLFFPNYNLASCFSNIDTNYQALKVCLPVRDECQSHSSYCCKETCGDECLPHEMEYLSMELPGIGTYLICMAVQGVVFCIAVMVIEYKLLHVLWLEINKESSVITSDTTNEDSDVAAERYRINVTSVPNLLDTDQLVLINLCKRYNNFTAVDHICVGIPEQECFGLLGQNGAGKTTTFKIITGDIMLSGGTAFVKGCNVRTDIKRVQANMGYCPQFDPLIDVLTGRETLTMYARLRGIPEDSIARVVWSLSQFIKMHEYLDDYCGNYSGGNKRKLSTAIALIGDPPCILLDEPSSGMDPEARRSLWTLLSKIRESGTTLVLTSHSMEECDALCTRIAIMVNGRFVCLGSPQHLKSKFAQGYTLIMKLGTTEGGSFKPSRPIIDKITLTFTGSWVFDDHEGYIHFQIPQGKVNVAEIFAVMEEIKHEYGLEDYSVHQTTLEQVFLSFTKQQTMAPESTEGKGLFSRLC